MTGVVTLWDFAMLEYDGGNPKKGIAHIDYRLEKNVTMWAQITGMIF